MKKNSKLNNHEKKFVQDCKFINVKHEYGKNIDNTKFIVFTDLEEEELYSRYGEYLAQFKPFIVLSNSHFNIFQEMRRNDDKFKKRNRLHGTYYDINDLDFYEHHPEQAYENDLIDQIMLKDQIMEIFKYMEKLTDLQKSRLSKYFLEEKTFDEIAQEEGVSRQAVMFTINVAIKKLQKMVK